MIVAVAEIVLNASIFRNFLILVRQRKGKKMKSTFGILFIGGLCLSLAQGQPGPAGMAGGPSISPSTAKLFGENSAFTAELEMQTMGGIPTTLPGKIAFDHGKSRFELDMAAAKSAQMPPGAAAQMKAMGMDKLIAISRPDKQVQYMVYPGLNGYVEMPITNPNATVSPDDFKVQTTEVGKETVDGHPCIKNKATVTDKDGRPHEAVMWNATDLKNFPIKIEVNEHGSTMTMLFKNVNLAQPDAAQFEPPAGLTKYGSMMAMMQEAMMKRMGGAAGAPPGVPAQSTPKQ